MAWRYHAPQRILWPSDLDNASGGSNSLSVVRAEELHRDSAVSWNQCVRTIKHVRRTRNDILSDFPYRTLIPRKAELNLRIKHEQHEASCNVNDGLRNEFRRHSRPPIPPTAPRRGVWGANHGYPRLLDVEKPERNGERQVQANTTRNPRFGNQAVR